MKTPNGIPLPCAGEGIVLRVRLRGSPEARHHYRLLNLAVACDAPLAELSLAPASPCPYPVIPPFVPRAGRATFSGDVFLAGSRVRLGAWWQGDRAWLEIDDVAIGVDLAAELVEVVAGPSPGKEDWLEAVLLGPPFLLSLARTGVFALHAGAVETRAGLVAFVGPSGAGKSTLARASGADWRPFADDLLPVTIARSGPVVALGGFPQLKWAPGDRRRGEGELRPLAAVVQLDGEGDQPLVRRLPPAEAAATWVAHTMIARLFSPALLAEHLAWAAAGAAGVPTWAARFPRGLERLPELRAWLVEALRV